MRRGFTLVEILVAVAILALLALALYGGYAAAVRQGRFQTACAFGASVRTAMERELQRELDRTLQEFLQALGLPQATAPSGAPPGTYLDCARGTVLWGAPPAYVACRLAAQPLQVPNLLGGMSLVEGLAVYTWVAGAEDRLCLNGARP